MGQLPLDLQTRAQGHAERLVETLGESINAFDYDAVCLYGMLCESLENIGSLDLTDRDRLNIQLKMIACLTSVRRSLGMTKDEQRKQASNGRIGRPPSNTVWDDVDLA